MYCARVLNPGSTTWYGAVPPFLVAVALVFTPGAVAGLLARLRPFAAIAIAPLLSSSVLAVSGIVTHLVGLRWGIVPLAAGTVVMWVGAALVGLAESRWAPRWSWLRGPGASSDEPRAAADPAALVDPALYGGARDGATRTEVWWVRLVGRLDSPAWATVASVAFALAVVGYTLVRVSNRPEAFPQHPDTIFHLADAQWMVEQGNISALTAAGYSTPTGTGFYPAAFHGFTATISLVAGVPVVVATSVFVLAVSGVVWPLGCIALARTLFGWRVPVILATGVTCVAFTGFPYLLMGFGVLWPNLFGETLLPSYLAVFVALFGTRFVPRETLAPRLTAIALLAVGLPGVTLAHPNALMSFAVFALVFLTGRTLGRTWQLRRRPVHAIGLMGAVVVALGALYAASRTVAPPSMVNTGEPGPELKVDAALTDLLYFAPRGAASLQGLAGVVGLGIIALLVRHRGARWVVSSMVVMFGLYWINVTVDSPWMRSLTWPWYNNAVRLQAVAILPTVMTAVAGLVLAVDLLARPLRRLAGATLLATVAVMAIFVLSTHVYITAHGEILNRYFHPPAANSWASDRELRALHTIGARLPGDAVVAANPWNGGTYLYVVSGRHLLVPTEKANSSDDRQLLSLRLDEVSTNREVCAAAKRQSVQWAITGGRPFSWAGESVLEYVGIDRVGDSPGWTRVEKVGPYTLYRLTNCAA